LTNKNISLNIRTIYILYIFRYIAIEKPVFESLCTYKLSQDHLELFFGLIRRRGGQNDNPTAQQFEGAYKRLLLHSDLVHSVHANCLQQDGTVGLSIGENTSDAGGNLIPNITDADEEEDFVFEYNVLLNALSTYTADITYNIAGFIIRKLNKVVHCQSCKVLLLASDQPESSALVKIKDQGSAVYASKDVAELCQLAEQVFDHFTKEEQQMIRKNCNIMENLLSIALQNNFNVQFSAHGLNCDGVLQEEYNEHPKKLIKLVLTNYFTIRLQHYGKTIRNKLKQQSKRTERLKLTHNFGH
jgi:DNA transposase THAP9